jgi:HK97 family phage prohead protease
MDLITVAEFRKQVRAHRKPTGGVFRVNMDPPADVPDKSRTKRFTFSDGSIDRMGDTISPDGWDIGDFTRNPVALWAHDSSDPPIGRASNVQVEGRRLMGDIEFAPPEVYAFAETIFRLVDGKFINAVSVGFLPLEYSFVENDPDRGFGIDFKRQELLEISLCPIPANANALGAARAGGIDTRPLVEWAERALDDRGRVILTRAELNRLRKAAKEPPMPSLRRRRAEDPEDDDKPEEKPADKADDKPEGNCGREPDEACGMKDPQECSVHASKKTDTEDDEDKLFRRLMLRWLASSSSGPAIRLEPYRREVGGGDDEPPIAHEDAIRLAHKCLRTSKAFLTEAVTHHTKAMGLLDGVVGALDDKAEDEPDDKDEPNDTGDGGEPAEDDKAKQLHRAALLRLKHRAA